MGIEKTIFAAVFAAIMPSLLAVVVIGLSAAYSISSSSDPQNFWGVVFVTMILQYTLLHGIFVWAGSIAVNRFNQGVLSAAVAGMLTGFTSTVIGGIIRIFMFSDFINAYPLYILTFSFVGLYCGIGGGVLLKRSTK